eukprot:TRINITY_DN5196_c0_g1_i1.p1 TRINITY_DN5196_c0_g1~~TRINITY_DN5196_c0_g1_i1.p1  ORF type:complete len:268 (-),score=106.20 TRINITY_DN5196_c0_g1_i1:51-854(-)
MMTKNLCSILIASTLIGAVLSDKFGGGAPPLNQYGSAQSQYGGGALSGYGQEEEDPLAALAESIPGVPGEDYPIYSEVPETSFLCEGQVDGGYYADPEAECQAFHICTADSAGGLAKYSFLCPNGTLFNQEYFICDWWFNFDCAQAEELYARNEEIAAEREAASGLDSYGSADSGYGSPSSSGYGSPKGNKPSAPKRKPSGSRRPSSSSKQYSAPSGSASSGYGGPSSASSGYGGPSSASSGYGGPSSAAPGGGYGAPTPSQPSYQF